MKANTTSEFTTLALMPSSGICKVSCGCILERGQQNMYHSRGTCGRDYGDQNCLAYKYSLCSYSDKPTIEILATIPCKPIFRIWKLYIKDQVKILTGITFEQRIKEYFEDQGIQVWKYLKRESIDKASYYSVLVKRERSHSIKYERLEFFIEKEPSEYDDDD
jgi:hypothetical protein